jgi:hypothetical protein
LEPAGENQTPSPDDLLALANAVREAARMPVSDRLDPSERPKLRLVREEAVEEETRF